MEELYLLNKETHHNRKNTNKNFLANDSKHYNNHKRPSKYLGLEGSRFGNLTLTNFIGFSNTDAALYQYKCDCGNIGICSPRDLFRKTRNNEKHINTCGSCPKNYFEILNNNTVLGYTDSNNVFIVDLNDFQNLNIFQFNWSFHSDAKNDTNRYYVTNGGFNHRLKQKISNKDIRQHTYILGLHSTKSDIVGDHIHNERGYDNRRQNIRAVTTQQNTFNLRQYSTNTTGVTGVYRDKIGTFKKPWYARIRINYEHILLGYFDNKEDAIKARKEAEIKYFGEFLHDTEKLKEEDKNDSVIQLLLKRRFINSDGSQNTDVIKMFIENHNFKYLRLNQIEEFNSSNIECDLPIVKPKLLTN